MIPSLAFAAAAIAADWTTSAANAAIFRDLYLNARIGNGNDEAGWTWYFGHDNDHPPEIRVSNLRCSALFGQRNCRFNLTRTADPASTRPEEDAAEPRFLRCSATFHKRREPDGRKIWRVLHFPPDATLGGHSRTSMSCRTLRVAPAASDGLEA